MSTKARPEWADRLERLRQTLGISQAGLAKRLHVSAMAPSRWERGINEPPAEIYIQLGKMVGEPACWYFWEKAGLKKTEVLAVANRPKKSAHSKAVPAPQQVIPSAGLRSAKATTVMCAIPLYAELADGRIDDHAALEVITAPKEWCKHPDETFCIRARDEKMAPVIRSGYIVAIDQKERERARLEGKIVLASHPEQGTAITTLQRVNGAEVLVPENRAFAPIYLAQGGWTILGRVVWWLAKAP